MPTYEYLCQTCSHRFETWQKMTDEPLTTCPECGNRIRRVLFAAGIVFKGQGFYKTDHAKGEKVATLAASDGKKAETSSENGSSNNSENGSNGDGKKAEASKSSTNGGSESKAASESKVSTPAPTK